MTERRIRYSIKSQENRMAFRQGFIAGIPIGLGYFAVAFSLGIIAGTAGLHAITSAIVSLFCNASAGEYAGFTTIEAGASFVEMALIIFIANCRYLLMSSAMSQRVHPGINFGHRLVMGLYVTDEIFAVSIARPDFMNPWFTYGCAAIASPLWALGTALGCIAGNILPMRLVSALSVALFGMFLAIIIPPARKEWRVAVIIIVCFAASSAATYLPGISKLSSGIRTIILTVIIAAAAALIFPRKTEDDENGKRNTEVD